MQRAPSAPRPRVFVTREVAQEAIDYVAQHCETEVWPGEDGPPYEVLRQKAAACDGLYTNVTDRIDAALLEAAPRLRVVSQMAVGVDNVDLRACTVRGIPVGRTPGTLHETTADLAFALLLAAARRVAEADRWVRRGHWRIAWHPRSFLGQEVHRATLGIVGFGQIGQEVAKRARGFDMTVLYTARNRRPEAEARFGARHTDLDTLLREADFVSLHVPLTPETRHLIGERELRLMKPGAVLVNVARGPVVDQRALYRALKEGWIAAAGLDVTDPEPIPPEDPLLTLENCIILPHIGSAGVRTRVRMALMAAENLVLALQGQRMRHCANPEVYGQGA